MKQLTELKVTDLLKGFNTTFKDHWEMYDMALKGLKKRLIEEVLEAERDELICCRSYARTPFRRDYRNGYWKRYILLKDGRLELRMPRMRSVRYESLLYPDIKRGCQR